MAVDWVWPSTRRQSQIRKRTIMLPCPELGGEQCSSCVGLGVDTLLSLPVTRDPREACDLVSVSVTSTIQGWLLVIPKMMRRKVLHGERAW